MTPMTLERALKEAIGALSFTTEDEPFGPEQLQAAAVLRAFMEKGLPFYRAAEAMAKAQESDDPGAFCCQNQEAMQDAYRAMKEGK